MTYARRVDSNHGQIRDALRAIGVGVVDTSSAGCGLPDLMCASRGKLHLVEIKNGERCPSARKLTIAQVQLHDMLRTHGIGVHIVKNIDEALAIFGVHVELTGPETYAERQK